MQVFFITANYDTFNNPTLNGVFHLLEKNNITVYLFCPPQRKNFSSTFKNIKKKNITILPNRRRNKIKYLVNYLIFELYLLRTTLIVICKRPNRIIGIDPVGIVYANNIYRKVSYIFKNLKLDYFSFEIFFKDEGADKIAEIAACKNISNLIVQDETREKLIKEENKISDKVVIHQIPVAPIIEFDKNRGQESFRVKHNVPFESRLLLNFGSFNEWTGSEIVFNLLDKGLPELWILVIHSTFPLLPSINEKLLKYNKKRLQVVLSTDYIKTYQDVYYYIKQFNCGLALYIPGKTIYTGRNLYHIGLSSGKISSYILSEIPIIMSDLPFFRMLNEKFNFGHIVNSADNIYKCLKKFDSTEMRNMPSKELQELVDPKIKLNDYIVGLKM